MTLGLGTRRICAAKTTPTRSATHRASPENFLRSESCPEAVSRLFPLPCPPSAAHIHTHKPSAHLTFLSRADGSSVQPADMGRCAGAVGLPALAGPAARAPAVIAALLFPEAGRTLPVLGAAGPDPCVGSGMFIVGPAAVFLLVGSPQQCLPPRGWSSAKDHQIHDCKQSQSRGKSRAEP